MCKKGFQMNKEKHCGGSTITITDEGGNDNGDGTDTGTDGNENTLIWSQCMIWLFLIIIL